MSAGDLSGSYIVGTIPAGMCYQLGSITQSNKFRSVVYYTGTTATGTSYSPAGASGTYDCAIKTVKIALQ